MHRKSSYWFCALVSLVSAGCGAPASDLGESSSPITIDTNATYTITGVQSGKCVEVAGGSTATSAQLQLATCNGTATRQRFRMESMGGGYYRVRNVNSNLCLDVSGNSTGDGARVIQWTCGTANNQQWAFTDVSTGVVRINPRHAPTKVLDVEGRSTADGARLVQWASSGGTNQQFRVQTVGSAPAPAPTPTPTTPPPPPPPTGAEFGRTCTDFATITMGKYWVNNNIWNRAAATPGGSQCVWGTNAASPIGWGTSWTWGGAQNQVKSYASTVLGWHWGWKLQNTGLPVQLSANRNVNTRWSFRVSGNPGTMNVAYDLWLHNISNPSWNNNPTDEVMIWLYRSGGAGPITDGNRVMVNIAGTSWELHRGNIGWNVFSFVRVSNTTSTSFNIRDFLNDLVARGWLQSSKYLTSVEAGTEVFTGAGRLDTDAYACDVQ